MEDGSMSAALKNMALMASTRGAKVMSLLPIANARCRPLPHKIRKTKQETASLDLEEIQTDMDKTQPHSGLPQAEVGYLQRQVSNSAPVKSAAQVVARPLEYVLDGLVPSTWPIFGQHQKSQALSRVAPTKLVRI